MTTTDQPEDQCSRCGRPAVPNCCLEPPSEVTAPTDEQIVDRAAPATWDGLRCFEARALLRLATKDDDAILIAHCERAIRAGCLAKDSLLAVAAAINARKAVR